MQRNSTEYLTFDLADRDAADLSGKTVSVAVIAHSADLGTATWLPATHLTGTRWRTTSVVNWTIANYPEASYLVYAKVVDSPETPVARIGRIPIST